MAMPTPAPEADDLTNAPTRRPIEKIHNTARANETRNQNGSSGNTTSNATTTATIAETAAMKAAAVCTTS